MRNTTARRLTPLDWARGALDSIGRGGIGAVAVEPIAAKLGATKGSFYWHFENRDALIEAALELWGRRTESVIETLQREPDPAKRLKALMQMGIELGPTDRAEIALLANPDHPAARRAVRRVAKRRLSWFRDQLEALGWNRQDAEDRAVLFCNIYVGNLQMAHLSARRTTTVERQRQVSLIFNLIVTRSRQPRKTINGNTDRRS